MRRTLLFLVLFAAAGPAMLRAEDVQVTSSLDKRSVSIGEELHLTIKIANAEGNLQAPRLPAFKGIDTFYTGRASHITFANGQSKSSVEFSYVLVPKESGNYKLTPIEVSVGSRRFVADPIDLEVRQGPAAQTPRPQPQPYTGYQLPPPAPAQQQAQSLPQPQSQPPMPAGGYPPPPSTPGSQTADDNIFVRAWVDKNSVYPNEQILLTYSLYTRYDTRYEGFDKEPQVSGFWIEDFPMERDVRRETVRMNGKRYVKADIRKMALFPTAAADYTIDPGAIKASIRQEPENSSVFDEFFNDSFFSGGSFFARREDRMLKPPPISVKVKPFPENGKPETFTGAVGNFRLNATLDKETVKQNDPVTLKLVIEGEGNIETLNKPKIPELKGFKIYDADTSSQLFKTGSVIGGRKTFEIVFIPLEAGRLKVPSLEFSFFNPVTAAYQRLRTPEFNLTVTPSDQPFKLPEMLSQQEAFKKDVKLEAKDIRYLRERVPDFRGLHYFTLALNALTVFNFAAAALVLAGLIRRRRETVFAKDNALRRRRLARQTAENRMRRLKTKDRAAYFDEVEKILTQYLSDKFNLSPYGVTRYDLERAVESAFGAEDPLFQDVQELYRLCDESRFGKAAIPEELQNKAVKILRDTIARGERLKK